MMARNKQHAEGSKSSALNIIGPGLITGASDDDPSGIATYSQAGAQFGYDLAWSLLFSYPLMVGIQDIAGRIGRVTGKGIAGNLRRHYPGWLLQTIVGLILIANIINLGADIGAMGAALRLLVGGPALIYIVVIGVVSVLLEIFVRYSRYVSVLRWLTLALLAYVATVFVVKLPWSQLAYHLFVPTIHSTTNYFLTFVAVLGTTISPYLFFWQAEQEVEDQQAEPGAKPLRQTPAKRARQEIRRIEWDTIIGMAVSNIVAFFIMVTAAATLHSHGVTNIETSAQAAEALRPIAGDFAFFLFALGIIGTGLLALPVLAGSAAYAVGEAQLWPVGLSKLWPEARAFYTTLALATFLGMVLNVLPIDPIKALFYCAVINGVVAVPVMAMMLVMGSSGKVMGKFILPRWLRVLGWLATAVMALAAIAMIVTSFWGTNA
ncbi:MAG TPA: Nramp family divalent metal transporter [Dongiaceae bacterium]|jgi:NRAMP (natural resistance-associated macrophage protein)-like metal ion transporter|nr:Nramp family divalent metal transporter [Dongiaceae bacterium]